MKRPALAPAAAVLAAALAGPAAAHDAFGDLGPFYASLLHPLADPAQGLLIAAAAILLTRQPLATVRVAYATMAACGAVAVTVHAAPLPLGLRATGVAVTLLGLLALSGVRVPPVVATTLAAAAAIAAGLAVDLPAGGRAAILAAIGGSAGIALLALLVWGGVDLATRRLGPIAGAVAGAWIAAIGIMSAALPA